MALPSAGWCRFLFAKMWLQDLFTAWVKHTDHYSSLTCMMGMLIVIKDCMHVCVCVCVWILVLAAHWILHSTMKTFWGSMKFSCFLNLQMFQLTCNKNHHLIYSFAYRLIKIQEPKSELKSQTLLNIFSESSFCHFFSHTGWDPHAQHTVITQDKTITFHQDHHPTCFSRRPKSTGRLVSACQEWSFPKTSNNHLLLVWSLFFQWISAHQHDPV